MPKIDPELTLPRTLYIESTNRCNLKCKGCILYRGKWEPTRDISLKEFVMITDQLPDLERVFLHGIGEPLLNSALFEMIRHLKKRNAYALFNSNGILLSAQRQKALIHAGLDELRISLDAASQKGYKKIRNSARFGQIVENLRSFVGLQKQQGVDHPKLSLWFLGTKDNIFELPGFIELAATLGIKEVYLQRLVYFLDDEGYGVAKSTNTLQDAADESSALIQKSQDLAARRGVKFNASGMSRPADSLHKKPGDLSPWSKCHRPVTLMYITAGGNVLPCCISPFSSVDYASLPLGNVFNSSLKNIWSGAAYRRFREQHQTKNPPKCCRGCGIEWSL